MATSIIKGGIESFSGTRQSTIGNGFCCGSYNNKTRTVRISFSAGNSNAIPIGAVLFNIPSKYRPNITVYGSLIGVADSRQLAGRFSIDSSGQLSQNLSSLLTAYFGYIEYTI